MWNCPNCGERLRWNSDYDDMEFEDVFYTSWTCDPCDIEVIQRMGGENTEEN